MGEGFRGRPHCWVACGYGVVERLGEDGEVDLDGGCVVGCVSEDWKRDGARTGEDGMMGVLGKCLF
jgi:hypothetical protein